jgi:BNR repeat-like domain
VIPLLITFLAVSVGPIAPDMPAKEPQMAVRGSKVALAFGAGNSIYFAISEDFGKTFSEPVRIAEAAVVPLTRHRGPRIVFAGGSIVVTAVAGKTLAGGAHAHGLPSDGDLVAWRSGDDGKTWSKGIVINDVPGAPTEGLHALATDNKGRLFAAWLDHRGGHGTKLYGAQSRDGGETWSKNVLIYESPDGSICECCHPSVAIESNGDIVTMWRNWLDGSRDMYLARSRDALHFSKPEKLGIGTWKLNACPMDGGGIAIADGRIMTMWRREHDIFLDAAGSPENRIGTGVDSAIAAGANGVYAIWSTSTGIQAIIPGKSRPVDLAPRGSFPAIAAAGRGALAAWEDAGKITIQQIP